MADTRKLEAAIGIFVIVAVVIIAGMILAMTGGNNPFARTYQVHINFNHIGDLRKGAPVKLCGYRIGKIDDIHLTEDNRQIAVVASIFQGVNLRDDSEAMISTAGLVGDTFVELSPGKSDVVKLKDNTATAKGVGQVSTAELMAKVSAVGDSVAKLAGSLSEVTGDPEFKRSVLAIVSNMSKATASADRLINNLDRSANNVFAASESIKDTTAKIGQSTAEVLTPETVKAIRDSIASFKDTSTSSKSAVASLDAILARTDKLLADKDTAIRSAIDDASASIAGVRKIMDKVDPNKGLLRYLTTDDLNKKIDELFVTIKEPMESLGRLFSKVSRLDILADYNLGSTIANKYLDELKKSGITKTADILDQSYKEEIERQDRREAPAWQKRYEEHQRQQENENLGK